MFLRTFRMCKFPAIAAATLAAIASTAEAATNDDRHWDHKALRSHAGLDMEGRFRCESLTGGDGDDSLNLLADRDGNVSVYDAGATARGYLTDLTDEHPAR